MQAQKVAAPDVAAQEAAGNACASARASSAGSASENDDEEGDDEEDEEAGGRLRWVGATVVVRVTWDQALLLCQRRFERRDECDACLLGDPSNLRALALEVLWDCGEAKKNLYVRGHNVEVTRYKKGEWDKAFNVGPLRCFPLLVYFLRFFLIFVFFCFSFIFFFPPLV
jgi:hypothetical protein